MTPFATVLADPPWAYGDRLRMSATKRGAAANYSVMSVEQICELGKHRLFAGLLDDPPSPAERRWSVAGHMVADDAFLWLWVTNPFLLDGSGASVCRAWGFEPKQLVTWVKGRLKIDMVTGADGGLYHDPSLVLHIGMGRMTRGATEHMILATRGKPTRLVKDKGVPNVFVAPKGRHSKKPEEGYRTVERMCPGPYLELFARSRRCGWEAWGNEV